MLMLNHQPVTHTLIGRDDLHWHAENASASKTKPPTSPGTFPELAWRSAALMLCRCDANNGNDAHSKLPIIVSSSCRYAGNIHTHTHIQWRGVCNLINKLLATQDRNSEIDAPKTFALVVGVWRDVEAAIYVHRFRVSACAQREATNERAECENVFNWAAEA